MASEIDECQQGSYTKRLEHAEIGGEHFRTPSSSSLLIQALESRPPGSGLLEF